MKKESIIITALSLCICGGTMAQRPIIPLEYVAEYNLGTNKATGSFTTSQRPDSSGFYTLKEVQKVCPQGYHVPTVNELYSIIPKIDSGGGMTFDNREYRNQKEEVEFGGIKGRFTSDFIAKGNVIYGIRFQDSNNKYRCAYRYHRIGVFGKAGLGDMGACLVIQAKYLGPEYNGDVSRIANEKYWMTDDIVTRIIPANGVSTPGCEGIDLRYGSLITLLGGDLKFYIMHIDGNQMSTSLGYVPEPAGVRLFLDKLPEQPVYGKRPQQKVYTRLKGIKRPILPIEKMAQTNVGKTEKTFAQDNSVDNTGLYLISEKNIQHPAGWHEPTTSEWLGIFPERITWDNEANSYFGSEVIMTNGTQKTYGCEYLHVENATGKYTCYGLKFKDAGNNFLSAYRYDFDKTKPYLKITCRYLGPTFTGTVFDLNRDDNFWEQDDTITVVLPYSGRRNSDRLDRVEQKGEKGHYWLKNPDGMCSYVISFKGMYKTFSEDVYGYALRLFPTGNARPKSGGETKKTATKSTKKSPVRR